MTTDANEMTSRMMEALNAMILDILASIARNHYADRKRIQARHIHH